MSTATATVVDIAISDLHDHPKNVRLDIDDLTSLAASIADMGIVQPLVVTSRPEGGYTIVAGHRRRAAALKAGLTSVPCVVRDTADAEQILSMLHENSNRDGLTAAERAQGIQDALDLGTPLTRLAKGLSLKPKEVKRFAAATQFAEATRAAMHSMALTLDQAEALAALEVDPEAHAVATDYLQKQGNITWALEQGKTLFRRNQREAALAAYTQEHNVAPTTKETWESNVAVLTAAEIKAHAGLQCHAVRARTEDDRVVFTHMCVSTSSHKRNQVSGEPLDAAAADAVREEERQARARVRKNNVVWEAVTDVRRAWVTEFSQRRTAPKGALLPVVQLLMYKRPDARHFAQALTTLDPTQSTAFVGLDVVATAISTDAQALRALVLTVLDDMESGEGRESWRQKKAAFATYLELLATWGYVLTPPEVLYIETVKADRNPAEVDYPGVTD